MLVPFMLLAQALQGLVLQTHGGNTGQVGLNSVQNQYYFRLNPFKKVINLKLLDSDAYYTPETNCFSEIYASALRMAIFYCNNIFGKELITLLKS